MLLKTLFLKDSKPGRFPARVRKLSAVPMSACLPACLLAVLWLTACGIAPVDDSDAARQARLAYDTGSYIEAAEAWGRAAEDPAVGNSSRYRLYSADAWSLADRHDQARMQLKQVSRNELRRNDATLYVLLQTEFALSAGDVEAAGFYLEAAQQNLPASLQDRYDTLNRRLTELKAGPSSQALARAFAAIRDMPFYQPEQALEILQLLEDVPSGQLRMQTAGSQADSLNDAWLQLALLQREMLFQGDQLETEVRDWTAEHPDFPLSTPDTLDLSLRYRGLFRPPSNVAVLLPAQGSMMAAGNAIRDGMMSAYLERPGGAKLTFYNAGSGPLEMVSAYFQALEDGADWIVGPVRRESVDQLVSLPVFNTPALVLNQPGKPVENGQVQGLPFYSLSLSQDADAASIAAKCLQLGLTRALVLVPDNSWGERMRGAFTAEFTQGEGEIVASGIFRTSENDHSMLLKQLLKIDQSIERDRSLRAMLGIPLTFEPVRRDDFDVIFLAATPEQGRQIKPQLKFYDAGGKPLFSTTRIYAGSFEPTANTDLNGIIFPVTQWQLNAAINESLPALDSIRHGRMGALHAVGRDAWNVLPWLSLMEKDPDFVFPGALGGLSYAQDGQLSRKPAWAVFRRGRPVAVDWPATP